MKKKKKVPAKKAPAKKIDKNLGRKNWTLLVVLVAFAVTMFAVGMLRVKFGG